MEGPTKKEGKNQPVREGDKLGLRRACREAARCPPDLAGGSGYWWPRCPVSGDRSPAAAGEGRLQVTAVDTAHPDGSGRRPRECVGADQGRPFLWEADTTEARLCAGKDPLAGAGFCFMFSVSFFY